MLRVEINVRASSIVGLAGAGGIGLYVADRSRVNNWDEVSFIRIMTLVVVTVIDLLSKAFRPRLIKATAPSIRRS